MKVAIIGSRDLNIDISKYIPEGTTEIISGGAYGIDFAAEDYADLHNIKKQIIKPEYEKYGRSATFIRNRKIVDISDEVVAIWNNRSSGTKYVINYAIKTGKPVKVYIVSEEG